MFAFTHSLALGLVSPPTPDGVRALAPSMSLAVPTRFQLQTYIPFVLDGSMFNQPRLSEKEALDQLRQGYNRELVSSFGMQRPLAVGGRFLAMAQACLAVRSVWDGEQQTRGAVLRKELSKLGPCAVKAGQTLSQRPDLIPADICEELKMLQTENEPFDNLVAQRVIAEEFGHTGPIAPNLPPLDGVSDGAKPLFARLSADPVASASLGQVYRGRTHEGVEVAVKVQRPDALRQCLLDGCVVIGVLSAIQGKWGAGDLLEIFDTIAHGVVQELDFRNEAANAEAFAKSVAYLGYVTVPAPLAEYIPGPRVLVSEWVHGKHMSDLPADQAFNMAAMAVEAVTAGLLLTGIVHADPHEGNIMLDDSGKLVFLDFGLMSSVDPDIMEAFADGIQAVLNKDWHALVHAFIATGFVGNPIRYREVENEGDFIAGTVEQMASELKTKMEAADGGLSRFGALSTVLFDMGKRWELYTPPYVLLLIRTFLTLEGVVAKVDPDFNIYEAALPWAIRRALSPQTSAGTSTLRSTILTEQNRLQLDKLLAFANDGRFAPDAGAQAGAQPGAQGGHAMLQADAQAAVTAPTLLEAQPGATSMHMAKEAILTVESDSAVLKDAEGVEVTAAVDLTSGGVSGGEERDANRAAARRRATGATTPMDSVRFLLATSDGASLRRIARDLDSTSLLLDLASPSARPLRRVAVRYLASAVASSAAAALRPKSTAVAAAEAHPAPWVLDARGIALKRRTSARFVSVVSMLLRSHMQKQLLAGWRGAAAVAALGWLSCRVGVAAVVRGLLSLRANAESSADLNDGSSAALEPSPQI